jgi:hypothetical protein
MKPWAGYLGVLILGLSPFLPWVTHSGWSPVRPRSDLTTLAERKQALAEARSRVRYGSLLALGGDSASYEVTVVRGDRVHNISGEDLDAVLNGYHAVLGTEYLPGGGLIELLAVLACAALTGAMLYFGRRDALWVPVAFLALWLAYCLYRFDGHEDAVHVAYSYSIGLRPESDHAYWVTDYQPSAGPFVCTIGWGAAGLGIVLISLESVLWWRTEWRRRRKVSLRTFD